MAPANVKQSADAAGANLETATVCGGGQLPARRDEGGFQPPAGVWVRIWLAWTGAAAAAHRGAPVLGPVLGRSGFECGRDLVVFLCLWSRNVAAAEDGSTPRPDAKALKARSIGLAI